MQTLLASQVPGTKVLTPALDAGQALPTGLAVYVHPELSRVPVLHTCDGHEVEQTPLAWLMQKPDIVLDDPGLVTEHAAPEVQVFIHAPMASRVAARQTWSVTQGATQP